MRTRRAVLRYLNEHDRWFADIGKQMFSLDGGEGLSFTLGDRKCIAGLSGKKRGT
jgi:hypothetical protein